MQGDRSVLVEVDHPGYEEARAVLARFAEIEKSPEHVHTYRLSDLALWNAASAGASADEIVEGVRRISRFELPALVEHEIRDRMARHGVCTLHDHPSDPARLRLAVHDRFVRERLAGDKKSAPLLAPCPDGFLVAREHRGRIKQALLSIGYPVDDRAGLVRGDPLPIALREDVFTPYDYQDRAARGFLDAGSHGVIVLPCGAGKTVVAMMSMAALGVRTLILASGREASAQWRREIVSKTSLTEAEVALYHTNKKDVGPVTITTYGMLARKGGDGPTKHVHFDRLAGEPWGLVVYDEVHLLPAPIFRMTADLQARRRLGLTATLVREDGREDEVFSLIGPKRYDAPWKDIEQQGYIAPADCVEVRLTLPERDRMLYATAEPEDKYRLAASAPGKNTVVEQLVAKHEGEPTLIIGQYLDQLEELGEHIGADIITGATTVPERQRLFDAFRAGEITKLVVSKVANFSIDLPEASVAIQVSGSFGSRQEEAQRLGRLLRPKGDGRTAHFYAVVARDTVDQDFAAHRQRFLAEQGYAYTIVDAEDLVAD